MQRAVVTAAVALAAAEIAVDRVLPKPVEPVELEHFLLAHQ